MSRYLETSFLRCLEIFVCGVVPGVQVRSPLLVAPVVTRAVLNFWL